MKYIKKFNESISEDDINDILLEVEDIGYVTSIRMRYVSDSVQNHFIHIGCPIMSFVEGETIGLFADYDEIRDCVLRLIDYLGYSYVNTKIFNGVWKEFIPTENNKPNYFFTSLIINYKGNS